jgi:hypothetical protein
MPNALFLFVTRRDYFFMIPNAFIQPEHGTRSVFLDFFRDLKRGNIKLFVGGFGTDSATRILGFDIL